MQPATATRNHRAAEQTKHRAYQDHARYGVLNKFIAAEITTTIRDIPIEVPLGKADGLPTSCVVNCDNLRTISKVHLVERISRIPATRVSEVKRAVGYALAWEELIGA